MSARYSIPWSMMGHQVSDWLNDNTWAKVSTARQSPLFETPSPISWYEHSVQTVDEFLAHITTIEAALGLRSDYDKPGATKRVARRVSGLLRAPADGDAYRHLFDHRSDYLHGRKMSDIAGEDRLLARRLARRVVNEIVNAAIEWPLSRSRAEYLNDLD